MAPAVFKAGKEKRGECGSFLWTSYNCAERMVSMKHRNFTIVFILLFSMNLSTVYAEGRSTIGIRAIPIGEELAAHLHIEGGLRITAIEKGSAADRAGFHLDDVLHSVDDRRVTTTSELASIMRETPPGTEITVKFITRGAKKSAVLATTEKPGRVSLPLKRMLERLRSFGVYEHAVVRGPGKRPGLALQARSCSRTSGQTDHRQRPRRKPPNGRAFGVLWLDCVMCRCHLLQMERRANGITLC